MRTLFQEQGITIASLLTAIGMAIGVLVEMLLPGLTAGTVGKPPPKDEKDAKDWLRNKLKALTSLLGRLGVKATKALPGIIGVIISWILNRARGDRLTIPNPLGSNRRYWRLTLYIYGYKK